MPMLKTWYISASVDRAGALDQAEDRRRLGAGRRAGSRPSAAIRAEVEEAVAGDVERAP